MIILSLRISIQTDSSIADRVLANYGASGT